MGDVFDMTEHTAVLMTYFRNNILHLLALPASVACCFIQGRRLEMSEIHRLIRLIYPFMAKELTSAMGYRRYCRRHRRRSGFTGGA